MDVICGDCKDHFVGVKKALGSLGVKYVEDPYIVRGLDYYTKTAFEVTHPNLGSQDAICAGGRYDNLVRDTGGPKTGACGFAIGQDRLVMALGSVQKESPPVDIFLAALGEAACEESFRLCNELRANGVSSEMDYSARSLKAQMRQANKRGARFVAILGEDELEKKVIVLRDMSSGQQREIKIEDFTGEIKRILC